jgi:hypothetical protein
VRSRTWTGVALLLMGGSVSDADAESKAPSGRIRYAEVGKRNDSLRKKLPAETIAALDAAFAGTRLVEQCKGHFTQDANDEWAVTLLEPAGTSDDDKPEYNVLRAVISAEGKASKLAWTDSDDFAYSPRAERDDDGSGVFYGEMKCLAPKALSKFLGGFAPEFKKPPAATVNLTHLDSVCFSVDAVYNNWECFAANATADLVRWGYSSRSD